jgi:hypothetical protein
VRPKPNQNPYQVHVAPLKLNSITFIESKTSQLQVRGFPVAAFHQLCAGCRILQDSRHSIETDMVHSFAPHGRYVAIKSPNGWRGFTS